MLGPVSESVFGEQDLLNLNLHAIGRFPSFNAELEEAAGSATGLRTEGTLAVAYDNDDLAALDRLTEFRHSIGLRAERLDAKACRRLEPFLAPSIRGGVLATGDLSVDNRRYLAALRAAAAGAGVRTVVGSVTEVADATADRIRVRLAEDRATRAVRPARRYRRRLGHRPDRRPPRPDPQGDPPGQGPDPAPATSRASLPHILGHTVRAIVGGRDIYLVPRADGELVVGATQEERDDRDVTAGAVHDLLRDAMTAVPAISELILAEASAGRRPGTSDNGPILGPVQVSRPNDADRPVTAGSAAGTGTLIVATGHFRNGVLLSAATADAVAALLAGEQPHPAWAPFHPSRL